MNRDDLIGFEFNSSRTQITLCLTRFSVSEDFPKGFFCASQGLAECALSIFRRELSGISECFNSWLPYTQTKEWRCDEVEAGLLHLIETAEKAPLISSHRPFFAAGIWV